MSTIQDHRIQITIPSDKEKDGIRINPFELGSLIRDLTPGTVCEVATPRKYIAQLQSLLAILEEAANNQSVPDTYTDGFCAPSSFYVKSKEKDKNEELAKLAKEWNSTPIADFNMDGFYPSYFDQPVKILFVGREACYMAGKNYITTVYDSLVNNDFNGWTVNQYPFNRRQFYLAYGILKAFADKNNPSTFPQWKDLPWASDMASGEKRIFGKGIVKPISWAFINLSKVSNQSGDYRTDSSRYLPFVNDPRNQEFLRTQIKILNPDLIIGANVYELLDILGYDKDKVKNENTSCYFYPSCKSRISKSIISGKTLPPFLNCYHFAAIKSDEKAFYQPVCDVLNAHIEELPWSKKLTHSAQGEN